MSLLVILLGITIDKFAESVESIRKFDWFIHYSDWMRQKLRQWSIRNDTVILLITLFIPVAIVALIYQQLGDLLSLLAFVFSVAVFVFCIGPRDMHNRANKYVETLERGDQKETNELVTEILEGEPQPEEETQLIRRINEILLIATNNNFLGMVFWFVILGPVGAVLYRLNHVLLKSVRQENLEGQTDENNGYYQSTQLLFSILNWIPSHLTAITYAVSGSFVDAIHQWKIHKSYDHLDPDAANNMLIDTGLGAIQFETDHKVFDGQTIHDVLGLCRRTIIVWITIIALLTLAGWAS
ncbi:MAG: regulatory signaling modulator protein AmpE [Gammaproteobacteria bacterium]|jgi:membrane protein required for beta-lactamase induction|nr:regulatory signaling modulator protein AmpE [Gammaproteobacteria bacterium]